MSPRVLFCAAAQAPIWHGGGIYFVHWLAEPFMLLGDLGVDRVWEERPVPPVQ